MNELQNKWSLVCNPAAQMHSAWQNLLPQWGVPENLAASLWQNRYKTGNLSRFLVERFKLGVGNLMHSKVEEIELLQSNEEQFENKITKAGALFFYQDMIKIIDGSQIRRIKKEFGEENFDFLCHGAAKYFTPPVAAFIGGAKTQLQISKRNALLLGLALLVKNLPQNSDILALLCLKLPPLADTPQPPEGFGLVQNKISALYGKANPAARKAVGLEGVWRQI